MARKLTPEQIAAQRDAERAVVIAAAEYFAVQAEERAMRGRWYAAMVAAQDLDIRQTRVGFLSDVTREHPRRVYDKWPGEVDSYHLDIPAVAQGEQAARAFLDTLNARIVAEGGTPITYRITAAGSTAVGVDVDPFAGDEAPSKAELAARAYRLRREAEEDATEEGVAAELRGDTVSIGA